uniref:Histone H2A C-terminal domain-containing protein n=1 Tax=Oryza barthii TaxID=65489 RepID=A0A0D3G8M7_9ORYZ
MGELSLNVVTLSLLVMFMGAELVMLCPTCRLSMTTIAEHADLPVVGIALRPLQAPSPFPPWHGLAGGWMLGFSGDLLSATLSNTFTGGSLLAGVTIAHGGVLPNINPVLLPKKTGSAAAKEAKEGKTPKSPKKATTKSPKKAAAA